jgi:hypothetical protein
VIRSLEHFFIPDPNNVFDADVGGVAFLFRFNVALLVALESTGLWGTARLIRSAWRHDQGIRSRILPRGESVHARRSHASKSKPRHQKYD